MQAIFETLFDIVYLVTVITLGVLMIRGSRGEKQYLLYGVMAVTLGCGDAFHLVPRAIALCTTGLEHYTAALGIGKLVTSVTMTLFYVLLYYVWRARYQVSGKTGTTAAVWVLALSAAANASISGIAGIGHILTGAGIILLLLSLKKLPKN